MAAIAGSPGKRRRVAATPAAMVSVSDLAEVSGLAASSRLSVTAAILDVGTLRDARTGRGSRITTKKVGSVLWLHMSTVCVCVCRKNAAVGHCHCVAR